MVFCYLQFYLTKHAVGKNRAEATVSKLAELNSYVPVSVYDGKLSKDFLNKFQCIVLTNSSLSEQIQISDLTHENGQKLIIADTKGLFGLVIFYIGFF